MPQKRPAYTRCFFKGILLFAATREQKFALSVSPKKWICLRIAAKRPTYTRYFFSPLIFHVFPIIFWFSIFFFLLCLRSQNMQETTDTNIAHDFCFPFCLFPSLQIMFALRNYATSDENTRARIGKADGMLQRVLQRVAACCSVLASARLMVCCSVCCSVL